MVHFTSAIALAVLAFCASSTTAAPVEEKRAHTLALNRRVKPNATARDYLEADSARRDHLSGRGTANAPIINAVQTYSMNIQVGNQTFTVMVDTGSSNLWIGVSAPVASRQVTTFLIFATLAKADRAYVPTSSATDTGNMFSVTYYTGYAMGEEYLDNVGLFVKLLILHMLTVSSSRLLLLVSRSGINPLE
jgi:hypothetical protein